jgi:hypothetical protein
MSYVNINFKKYVKNTKRLGYKSVLLKGRIDRYLFNKNNYIYSPRYDTLINYFQTANNLAEALSSENKKIRRKAYELMNYPTSGHIYRGIGWYLNNGRFVRKHNNNIIFVGKQETMEEDIEGLSVVLNKELKNEETRINNYSTKESKYLSPLAIKNIIKYYKYTDYAALIELNKHGWISDSVLELYYKYP